MLGSDEALMKAVYAALSDDLRVYDVPQQELDAGAQGQYPYVTLGDNITTPANTDDEEGDEIVFTLHYWSRAKGKKEIQQMMRRGKELLHRQSLAVTDWTHVYTEFEGAETLSDPDGVTQHGIQRFRAYLDQTD